MSRISDVRSLILIAAGGVLLAGCSSGPRSGAGPHYAVGRPHYTVAPYQINGVWYTPKVDYHYDETGTASWYGPGFDHRATADGEIYDMNELSAAHKTLPLPSVVDVTNLQNGRELRLRVNDRGPFIGDRLIDLSRRAAQLLGFERSGTAQVRVRIVKDESIAVAEAAMLGEMGPVGVAAGQQPEPIRLAAAAPPPSTPPVSASQPPFLPPATPAARVEPPQPAGQPPFLPPVTQAVPLSPPAVPPPPPQLATAAPSRHDYWPSLIAPARAATLYPPPSARRNPAPAPAAYAGGIFVQAGAFSVPGNARFVRAALAGLGGADIVPIRANGLMLYRVRVGPVASEGQARRLLRQVLARGFAGARLVDR
jgi:rare lipoprotein A